MSRRGIGSLKNSILNGNSFNSNKVKTDRFKRSRLTYLIPSRKEH